MAESTIELAEMACADHGKTREAHGVLRELIPSLTLREACAAIAEAVRRADARRLIKPADLTVKNI